MKKRIISFILSIVMILLIIPPASYTAQAADFETQLRNAGFTDSYISKLLDLHKKYPNWKFEPLMVGENFSTAVSKERQYNGHAQQLIEKWSGNEGKGYYCTCSSCTDSKGNPIVRENPNWVAASQSAVEYYLDPRNFLNEEYIFQFESTEYNSAHTQTGVETILAGTFMAGANITYKDAKGNTVTYKNSSGKTVKYSQAIMEASKDHKISAYYIAAKIVQEVGGKTASAGGASGTNSTYPGIYNFYNINANTGASDGLKWASTNPEKCVTNTTCRLRQGPSTSTAELAMLPAGTKLTYKSTTATQSDGDKWINVSVTYGGKSYTGYIREDLVDLDTNDYNRPWTNPYLSIYNGAKWIANNFGGTQFTGYLQKFNVNPASGSSMHGHEYMANVQGAASEGARAYNAYKNANILNTEITFTIPVFNNMPNDFPGGIKANASNSGIEISWNSFPGAQKYRVYYKTDSGSWTKIADTTSTSYTWTGAKIGTKYAFTVRCISSDGSTFTSSYDTTGVSLNYVANPKLSSVENAAAGVKMTWDKVTGAEKYRVFYKIGSSGWTKIADTTSTSYTWTGAKSNTNYTFTVRCITSDGTAYTSGYDAAGKSLTYIAAPKLTSVDVNNNGVAITWGKVTGAEKYRVFYKTGSSGWTKIVDTTSTSYTWTGAKTGTDYTFTVRCISSDAKSYVSAYDSKGMSIKAVNMPSLSSVSQVATGIQISWGKISGAEKYRVFYKANGESSWHKAGDTVSTSYVWTGAKSNTKYTFTVRCITSDGNSYTSAYDTTGKSINYIAAPKISSVSNGATGVEIKWGSVAGAAKYRVFYKANGESSWHKAGDTVSTSYTWTGAKSGTKYTFTVRCITSDGSSYTSAYDTTGKSINYIAAPKISVSKASSGVQIKWGSVTGAAKYRVFYKANGESTWHKVVDTTATSYTWTGAKSGTKYTFTVRCITSDGNSYTSGYDTTGISITA